ncbi:hypothetical protein FHX37_1673 [Haloactinospora alba]|uniref:Endonuclease III n=1 Tax=Haloactinospora alba TaxID=405555 RepID=A0A543NIS9_9ACTN|nr:endonuclease [Haloactinospora alba]TQN31753.1 hypothetical protein FHX37_1673 [Haloactinospora alba]
MTDQETRDHERTAQAVLRAAGDTLAQQAGIRMADEPAPLWQLLTLVNLLSTRISASIALAAAREINTAGGTTPTNMTRLSWQERVDALGRGKYVRYDESTATRLGECAQLALDEYHGDLRGLASAAQYDRKRVLRELQRFPGIGPTGAGMFCREVQAVWPWLRPYTDRLARRGAQRLGLNTTGAELQGLVASGDMAALAAGLVAVARDDALAERVLREAGH